MKDNSETNTNYKLVLSAILHGADSGKDTLDIFDIRFETSLTIEAINEVLDTLIGEGKIENVDRRYFKFIGSIDDIGEITVVTEEQDSPETEDEADKGEHAEHMSAARRRFEARRAEYIRRLKERLANEIEPDDDDDEDEDDDDDEDEDDDDDEDEDDDDDEDDEDEDDEVEDDDDDEKSHSSDGFCRYNGGTERENRYADKQYAKCVLACMKNGSADVEFLMARVNLTEYDAFITMLRMLHDGYLRSTGKKGKPYYEVVISDKEFLERFGAANMSESPDCDDARRDETEFSGASSMVMKGFFGSRLREKTAARCSWVRGKRRRISFDDSHPISHGVGTESETNGQRSKKLPDILCDDGSVCNMPRRFVFNTTSDTCKDGRTGKFVSCDFESHDILCGRTTEKLKYINGDVVKFLITECDDGVIFSDDGLVYDILALDGSGRNRLKRAINKNLRKTSLCGRFRFTADNEITLTVVKSCEFFVAFFVFYRIVEKIFAEVMKGNI